MLNNFRFIDLFCGVGGFHLAMAALGGECVFACDIDNECQKTYKTNFGITPESDIRHIHTDNIPPHDVLCAGFPCQSFSKAGNRLGFKDDTKGTLFFDICRILEHHQPKYALLENVRNLASHDHGKTWKIISHSLESLGYNVPKEPVIFSPHYIGIPQHRERVFIMCTRKDIGEIPQFHFNSSNLPTCNIDDILLNDLDIKNLQKYKLSDSQIQLINLWDEFITKIHCQKLPGFPIWSDRFCDLDPREDLSLYPSWKSNFIMKNHELYMNNKPFIDDWLQRAKNCQLFFGSKAKLEWQAGQYARTSIWDNILQMRPSGIRVKPSTYFPALVAITQTSIVGKRKRFITPRECARLQSFPDSFIPNPKDTQAYKQFGNAVNVEVAKLFARYLFGEIETRNQYALTKETQSNGIQMSIWDLD